MSREDDLRNAIGLIQATFSAGVGQAGIVDVGFIGNTSGVYPWEPALIVDVDIILFVAHKDVVLGEWLLDRGHQIRARLEVLQLDFELKVLRGPYKPSQWQLQRPVVIAHLAVFTPEAYALEPIALRWSWRKYRCVVEPLRFNLARGLRPDWSELSDMARRKLARIQAERVQMTEWELPDFTVQTREFDATSPVFVEYCLTAPLLCARNHGRILGFAESDRLGNQEYVAWYLGHVMNTVALAKILELKNEARQKGYAGLMPQASCSAQDYLRELIARIP